MANAQYAILRFAKYKGPEISGIEAHNERTKEKYASNPDIDPSRTHLNFHLIIKQKRNAFPKHSANVKIRGSYEKEKLSKVFLALTVIIIK